MIWGPFLLALALGLVVSAGLYFAYLWPVVEPDDGDADPDATAAAPGDGEDAPTAATEAATGDPAPSQETTDE